MVIWELHRIWKMVDTIVCFQQFLYVKKQRKQRKSVLHYREAQPSVHREALSTWFDARDCSVRLPFPAPCRAAITLVPISDPQFYCRIAYNSRFIVNYYCYFFLKKDKLTNVRRFRSLTMDRKLCFSQHRRPKLSTVQTTLSYWFYLNRNSTMIMMLKKQN